MGTVDRKAYGFFREHAGYVVGENARGALALARAEELLEQAVALEVASVEWVDDDEPYDYNPRGRGFEQADAEDAARRFASNEWTGPFGCIVKAGEQQASLWGIVLGRGGTWWPESPHTIANGDPYGRVIIAELASELEDDLRQAIGDALDAREEVACNA